VPFLVMGTLALTASPAYAADNYPSVWKNQPLGATYDTWGMATRYCTSWVAWALHDRNGFEMPFHDDAQAWGSRATALGYTVNMAPAVGAVAWWNSSFGGGYGHVAYVESVNGSTVHVSEYNYDLQGNYHERDIAANSVSGFIHFKDSRANTGPLSVVQPISVGPSGTVAMYTPVNYSYRVKNTSGGGVSVQRMVVAVRGPGGSNLDVSCSNGLSLAAGQEFTCAVTVPTGYGSTGPFQFWADWLDFAGAWHTGQLGNTANYLRVTPAATLTTTGALSVGPANPVHMYQGVYWSYRVQNTSGGYMSVKRFEVAVRSPGGGAMDVPCQYGDGVTLAPMQEFSCAAYNNNGYGSTGPFQFWADWQDYANLWHPGQLSGTLTLSVVS
jgi:surface antigen